MPRPRSIAFALALAALLPAPAFAQRDCCFVRTVGAAVRGCLVTGVAPEDFPEWAARLGFDAERSPGEAYPSANVGGTRFCGQQGPPAELYGLPCTRLMPCASGILAYDCPGRSPPFAAPPAPHDHPNGALRVLGFFAVAGSARGMAAAFPADRLGRDWGRELGCGEDPAAGATACEWRIGESFLRVLVPEDSTGLARRWMPGERGGWVGMVVAVRDLRRAELALRAQGTAVQAVRSEFGDALLVEPGTGPGPVVEFVRDRDAF